MTNEPKDFWKTSWTGRRVFRAFGLLWLATFLILFLLVWLLSPGALRWGDRAGLLCFSLGLGLLVAALFFGLAGLIRWLGLRRLVFMAAGCVTVVALLYAEEDWRGWHAWHQFEAQHAGEHFTMAGMAPAPVPDAENFALAPIVYSSYGAELARDGKSMPPAARGTNLVNRLLMPVAVDDNLPGNCWGDRVQGKYTNLKAFQNYYRAAAAKTNVFPVPAQPGSPADDVLLALSKYDPPIAELRAAVRLPGSRFPLNYDALSPGTILLIHLAPLKSCVLVLQLRSAAELQNGRSGAAAEDICLGLRLSDKISTEPFLISQLVRIAMVQIMAQPIWEGLASHQWSDAQLAAMDEELAKLDFAAAYRLGIRGEMACAVTETERFRRHRETILEMYDSGSWGSFLPRLIPGGWFYQNEYRCARSLVDDYIPVANEKTFSPVLAHRSEAMVMTMTNSHSPYLVLSRGALPALEAGAVRFADGQTTVSLARTAIALERYRLAHGMFPESLEALAPKYLDPVPQDVIDGGPLKYRRLADDRFLLYSVGWNQTDDGGAPAYTKGKTPRLDRLHGDWVWQAHP